MPTLAPAFPEPVHDAQRVFRAVMNAMARPGFVFPLEAGLDPPAPLTQAAAAVALSLIDYETPVFLDAPLATNAEVARWLRFHTGAPVTADPSRALFAMFADAAQIPPLARFALGTAEYPDRSTTLVIQVAHLDGGPPLTLEGPGLPGARAFAPAGLPPVFSAFLAENRSLFPRGVDVILTGDCAVAALPRTTRVEAS